ncbi:hypothetical protein [Nonlabens sp. Asnod3-H03]|uniref:hypothetical protein n=1 Tax=Nonlabens sp. Asnod3-H03 TaxID=3160580 RepID=UPI003865C955
MKITYVTINLILILFSSSLLFSSEKVKNDEKEFLISIEMLENNELQLVCTEGCAWETLSFTLSNNENDRMVNTYGLNVIENQDTNPNKGLALFLFSVQKSGNGLQLKGIKGTRWTDLNFSLRKDKPASVDNAGVTL